MKFFIIRMAGKDLINTQSYHFTNLKIAAFISPSLLAAIRMSAITNGINAATKKL
jgi:hypothetical protein